MKLGCLALALAACASAPPVVQQQQLPADGRLFENASTSFVAAERYRGRVVVLDFWAGWCHECKQTIPQVSRLAEAFAPEGLVVVGVNAGEAYPDVQAHAHDFGIDYPIALDPELVFSDRLGAGKLPMLLVIDRNGAVVHRAKRVDSETLAIIRKLLHP